MISERLLSESSNVKGLWTGPFLPQELLIEICFLIQGEEGESEGKGKERACTRTMHMLVYSLQPLRAPSSRTYVRSLSHKHIVFLELALN